MTLDSNLSKAGYQGNGTATEFPFSFKVWSADQIAVTVTDAEGVSSDVTSNCTVTLTSSGGSVTYPNFGSPLPSGAKLAITRNMPFTQGINLASASRFDPQVIEDGLDQATAERQQMLEQMARAVILPATSSESPEDVVASIYASRDAAAASAGAASAQATAAEGSAQAAANSADTAAQTVATATAEAVSAATAQADAAAASAAAAAQSALDAAAASSGLAPRMDAVEEKNSQQDGRLDAIDGAIIAVASLKLGDLVPSMASSREGCLLCNGGAYSRTTYAALFAILGTSFGIGDGSTTFNVPDFRGRTLQGANDNLKAVLAAGLPNATGTFPGLRTASSGFSGAFSFGANIGDSAGGGGGLASANMSLANSNSIYGASTTVQPPAIATNIFIKY